MATVAKRDTVNRTEHFGKKFRNAFDMVGMASGFSAGNTQAIISGKNITCPVLHGLRGTNVPSDKCYAALPEVVIRPTLADRKPFVSTGKRTVLTSLRHTWGKLEFLTAGHAHHCYFIPSVRIVASCRTKGAPVVLGRTNAKLFVTVETGLPTAVNCIAMKTISGTIGTFWGFRRVAEKGLVALGTHLRIRRATHTRNTITINQHCQVKRDEFGERYTEKHANTEPSRSYSFGRCRDYWRGLVPLITSKSVPPEREDIVQSSEKSGNRCTETESTITINNYYYAAIALEDVIKPMTSVDLLNKYVPGLGYALALQEDDTLAALVDDGTITQSVGTLGTELTHDNLIRGDQYLNDANVPPEDRAIAISPAQKAGFMRLDQFVNKDYADLRTGLVGSWMGYPIHVSTNIDGTNAAGHDNFMGHKECIAHIRQLQPYVRSWWDGDYQCAKMSTITTYGNTIRRADHGVWLKGA